MAKRNCCDSAKQSCMRPLGLVIRAAVAAAVAFVVGPNCMRSLNTCVVVVVVAVVAARVLYWQKWRSSDKCCSVWATVTY